MYERSPATIIGFGGARGGAMSYTARAIMIKRTGYYDGTGGFIIRKTIDDLRDNHIRPMFNEYPNLRRYYRKQEKILDLPMSFPIPGVQTC